MRAFVQAAGVRVVDELLIEVGIEHSVDCVVEKTISNRGFVDIARFGV